MTLSMAIKEITSNIPNKQQSKKFRKKLNDTNSSPIIKEYFNEIKLDQKYIKNTQAQTNINDEYEFELNKKRRLIKQSLRSSLNSINDIRAIDLSEILNDMLTEISFSSSKIRYNELGLPMSKKDIEIQKMLNRAASGKPPAHPYFPKKWTSVMHYLKSVYGNYLSSCNSNEDYLYMDQIGELHPNGMKNKRLENQLSQLQNIKTKDKNCIAKIESIEYKLKLLEKKNNKAIFGYDLRMAIINYSRNMNINTKSIIKSKKNRTEKNKLLIQKTKKSFEKLNKFEKVKQVKNLNKINYLKYI